MTDPVHETLSAVDHLIRISVVVRGTRPSPADLLAVRTDPKALPGLVDAYLESAQFGRTIRDLENETLRLRAEVFQFRPSGSVTNLVGSAYELNRLLFEEPLRLIEHIVKNNRPYTEIVTADYALHNEVTANSWRGVGPYDPNGAEFQEIKYTDGRPGAGVMSSGAFYLRYRSGRINLNRNRANQASRAFLCYDYLTRDIILDEPIDLTNAEAIAQAVSLNPLCVSCHQTLDPMASFFFVNRPNFAAPRPGEDYFPILSYLSQPQATWQNTTGQRPALNGRTGDDMNDLGQLIANDPRFSICTARRYYAYLSQVAIEDVPFGLAASLQDQLIKSNFDIKTLVKAIVLSEEFKVSHAAGEKGADSVVGYKKIRPEQLDRMIHGLTGFRWETLEAVDNAQVELLTTDLRGYRLLGGGIDSRFVVTPVHTMNATSSLLIRELANLSASYLVDNDFRIATAMDRRLLRFVAADDRDEATIRTQLVELHTALYGEFHQANDDAIDDSWALFHGVLQSSDDPIIAWKITLTGMLQDVRITYY